MTQIRVPAYDGAGTDRTVLPESSAKMIRHDFASFAGVRLHYAAAGTGELILFAHGFPEFWYAWRKQLVEFSQTHLVVAPDLRGYNLSSKPKPVEEYAMDRLVGDVRALAAHFAVAPPRKFTLVGHDWGGFIAWMFALAYPEWLDRLIIINAPHPVIFNRELSRNPAQQKASRYIQVFRSAVAEWTLSAMDYAALVQTVLADGLRRGYFSEEDKKAYMNAWAQPGALTGGLNYYRAASLTKPDAALQPSAVMPEISSWIVRVPTLVLWGMRDSYLLPGNLEGLGEFVPNLQIERFPHSTHWIVHEMPQAVNASIRKFLDSTA